MSCSSHESSYASSVPAPKKQVRHISGIMPMSSLCRNLKSRHWGRPERRKENPGLYKPPWMTGEPIFSSGATCLQTLCNGLAGIQNSRGGLRRNIASPSKPGQIHPLRTTLDFRPFSIPRRDGVFILVETRRVHAKRLICSLPSRPITGRLYFFRLLSNM